MSQSVSQSVSEIIEYRAAASQLKSVMTRAVVLSQGEKIEDEK